MNSPKVRRHISAFAKSDERYVGDLDFVKSPSMKELRSIFKVADKQDPMYDEYPIDAGAARKLAPLVCGAFDLVSCDYFLSCERLD